MCLPACQAQARSGCPKRYLGYSTACGAPYMALFRLGEQGAITRFDALTPERLPPPPPAKRPPPPKRSPPPPRRSPPPPAPPPVRARAAGAALPPAPRACPVRALPADGPPLSSRLAGDPCPL